LHWHLLSRAVELGQRQFDFKRSTFDSGTYRFNEQWGARPSGSMWYYYSRIGRISQAPPDNDRFGKAIKIWRGMPVALRQWIWIGDRTRNAMDPVHSQ